MIDISKYEGHNISKVSDFQCGTATIDERKANWNLIQDAPLLLAEVKRLRETYNLATCQSCTCNGDGIAGSAYEGHIIKCACMEEEK